jgi:hypothetical protein
MSGAPATSSHALHASVVEEGFAFVDASTMRTLLTGHGSLADWSVFTDSWNRLAVDTYMADGGRYRRRRHAVYAATPAGPAEAGPHGDIELQPHQPHFQPLDYNPLNGGVERWFEPIEPQISTCESLRTILAFCRSLFGSLAPAVRRWHVEVHQFRIEARQDEAGRPTPEGLHRDGVDYVLVLLIDRQNIARGMTTIHGLDAAPGPHRLRQGYGGQEGSGLHQLGHFTLTTPFDAALVDDRRVAHGVTPVEPIDPSRPAYRDVLVVTFRR